MTKKTKAPAKKKITRVSSKKLTTKPVAKKKAAEKKNNAPKKNIAVKKKTAGNVRKKVVPAAKATAKPKTKIEKNKLPVKNTEANMPATEEKSVTNSNTSEMLGMDKKSIEQAAVRHYDNHHLRLSSVGKGRTKPSGKKPLW